MKVSNAALLLLIFIIMMFGVFAAQAQDAKPLIAEEGAVLVVEEGSPLQESPSNITTPQESSALGYKISTSKDDPLCDTGFGAGGYFDLLEKSGLRVSSQVQGDNSAFRIFKDSGPIEFYDQQYDDLWISDDGYIFFDLANYRKPWEPQIIPQADAPNGLIALLWQDMEIVHNSRENHGVTFGSTPELIIVEFDDVRKAGNSRSTYDMELVMRRQVSNEPGDYEIVFAYDNLNGTLEGPLTIGIENATGDSGVALVNRDSAKQVISNGFMVCFDADRGKPPSGTPSKIQASDGTYEDKVKVIWTDVNQAARYDVYRADENGNYEIKLGTAGDALFNDISATAGITYTYRVKACNEFGCSTPSIHDTGWRADDSNPPPPPPPTPTPLPTPPPLPDNANFLPLTVTN